MLICGCMKSMVWFPYFRLSLVAVRTAPISGRLSILNHKLSKGCFNEIYSLTQMITLYTVYLCHLCIYIQTKFFIFCYALMRLFSYHPQVYWTVVLLPPKTTPRVVLRLKCEDDNGTCHGQWFGEPCRLRLGRGSVWRMLVLPCTNEALTSKKFKQVWDAFGCFWSYY